MSANNFILIRENDSGEFWVEECDIESGETLETIGDYKHSLDALTAASDFMYENEVEAGISFRKYTA